MAEAQTLHDFLKALESNAVQLVEAAKREDVDSVKDLLRQMRRLERRTFKLVQRDKILSKRDKHHIYRQLAELQALRHVGEVDLKSKQFNRLQTYGGEEKVIVDSIEEEEANVENRSPVYKQLCVMAGFSSIIPPDELGKRLYEKEQGLLRKGAYQGRNMEGIPLYPLIRYVEDNISELRKISGFMNHLSIIMFLFYVHTTQPYIQQFKFDDARYTLNRLLWWQPFTIGFQYHDNHGPHLMKAFLDKDLPLFERIARESWNYHTGFGWDGGKRYEREIVYGMHAYLHGVSPQDIMTHMKDGTVSFVDIKNLGLLSRSAYFFRRLFTR